MRVCATINVGSQVLLLNNYQKKLNIYMKTNTKENVLRKLAEMKANIGQIENDITNEASAVEQVTNSIKEFTNWLGITTDEPTATELKEAVTDAVDKASDVAVEKTIEEAVKIADKKGEDVKATQTEDVAKAAVVKTKDAVVAEVKEAVTAKKEQIKKDAKEVA